MKKPSISVTISACACLYTALARPVVADDLYTALRQDVLYSQLNFQTESVLFEPDREFPLVTYKLSGERFESFSLAAHASVAIAEQAFRRRQRLTLLPVSPPEGEPIGDQWYSTTSTGPPGEPAATNVVWRRKNVIIDLDKDGHAEQVIALARQIDALLRDNRQFAPLGTFDATPEIVAISAPETIALSSEERTKWGKNFRISAEFRGLGDVQNLRIKVYEQQGRASNGTLANGKSNPRILVPGGDFSGRGLGIRQRTPEEDGRLEISLVRNVKPGPLKLTMIAATPDNVVVTKEFTVVVGQ